MPMDFAKLVLPVPALPLTKKLGSRWSSSALSLDCRIRVATSFCSPFCKQRQISGHVFIPKSPKDGHVWERHLTLDVCRYRRRCKNRLLFSIGNLLRQWRKSAIDDWCFWEEESSFKMCWWYLVIFISQNLRTTFILRVSSLDSLLSSVVALQV